MISCHVQIVVVQWKRWRGIMQFKLGSRAFNLNMERIPNIPTLGVTNRTEDGRFVFFQDYDNVEWQVVLEDLHLLTEPIRIAPHPMMLGSLRNFVVLENDSWVNSNAWGEEEESGSYLVFGLDRMSFYQHSAHQAYCRGDSMHRRVGLRWHKRLWVNRIAAKYSMEGGELAEVRPEPKVRLKLFLREPSPWEASKAFVDMFREWFGVRFPKHIRPHDDGSVEVIEYSTIKKKEGR